LSDLTSSNSTSFKRVDLVSPKQFNIVGYDRAKVGFLEQINEDGSRKYVTPSGNRYPSITSVMSWQSAKGIAEWRARVGADEANRISKNATRRGTALHGICENYLLNEEVLGENVPVDVMGMFKSIKYILDASIDNIHCIETRLYSDYIGVAGTVDCIAEFDGKMSVIDFKTSRKIKEKKYISHYFMQTAGYAIMYEELLGIPVPQTVIIMVSEDDEMVFIEKRDNYAKQLINLVKEYRLING
jgi:CRISPR/Cas system-associated exonuclease Cas4 (RecB family)